MVTKKVASKVGVEGPKEVKEIEKKPTKGTVTPVLTVPAERYFAGVGRRKTAVATVRIFEKPEEGEMEVVVNGKKAKEYFPTLRLQGFFLEPIRTVGLEKRFGISVHVRGGGPSGQAAAAGLGLARALVVANSEHRPLLKSRGFLSRDARKVERKKAGLKKARRAPQWSKR